MKIFKIYFVILAISLLPCAFNHFNIVSFVNVLFIVGMLFMILAGVYYLVKQNAFKLFTITFKKILYSLIESFSSKDYFEKRKKLNDMKYEYVKLSKDAEFLIVGILVVLTSIVIPIFSQST